MTGRNATTHTRQDKVNPTVQSGFTRSSLQITASDKFKSKKPLRNSRVVNSYKIAPLFNHLKKLVSLTKNFSKMGKYTQIRNHSHLPKDITDPMYM